MAKVPFLVYLLKKYLIICNFPESKFPKKLIYKLFKNAAESAPLQGIFARAVLTHEQCLHLPWVCNF